MYVRMKDDGQELGGETGDVKCTTIGVETCNCLGVMQQPGLLELNCYVNICLIIHSDKFFQPCYSIYPC